MRKTLNWKHNSKEKKQYLHNGKIWLADGGMAYLTETAGYWKRQSPFMDLSDINDTDN